MFENEDHENIAAEMAKLLKHINKEDHELITSLQKVAASGTISDLQVSELLMANRVFTQSSRQIIAAMREVLLTGNEIAMFDSLIDTELIK